MVDPPAAGGDLADVGLVVDPPFAAKNKFKMLDGVGAVAGRTVDPRFLQSLVEHCARRTDERPPGEILLVARLLSDKHDSGVQRTLPEHGLGGELVELAPRASA